MAGNVFAPAALGLLLSAVVGTSPARAQAGPAPVTDSGFVQMAASGGLAEVQLGKLAQQKATSAEVKQFGQRMVTDHTKANKDLAAAAQKAGITPPTALLPKHQQTADRLGKQSGAEFDKAYMETMVEDHMETVGLFMKEAESGQAPELKQLAKQSLPVLEEHLARARKIAGGLGVDTTTAGTAHAEHGK
jgi:putative membrane protein